MLFLFFAFFPIAAAGGDGSDGSKPPCGPTDWFIYNLRHSVYQPFLDKFTYILHAPPSAPPPLRGGGADGTLLPPNYGTCESIGINGGLDVMHVFFKIYSGGFVLPLPMAIQDSLYVFDVCTEHVSRADFVEQKLIEKPYVKAHQKQCERATMLFQCAAFNMWYMVPWLVAFVVVWMTAAVVGGAWLVSVCL